MTARISEVEKKSGVKDRAMGRGGGQGGKVLGKMFLECVPSLRIRVNLSKELVPIPKIRDGNKNAQETLFRQYKSVYQNRVFPPIAFQNRSFGTRKSVPSASGTIRWTGTTTSASAVRSSTLRLSVCYTLYFLWGC